MKFDSDETRMLEDFLNPEINSYVNQLHPGERNIRKADSKLNCRICLSKVPDSLTKVYFKMMLLYY